MYLINDNKIKKSLSEKAKDKAESLLKSSLFENNFKAKTNIYDELNIPIYVFNKGLVYDRKINKETEIKKTIHGYRPFYVSRKINITKI